MFVRERAAPRKIFQLLRIERIPSTLSVFRICWPLSYFNFCYCHNSDLAMLSLRYSSYSLILTLPPRSTPSLPLRMLSSSHQPMEVLLELLIVMSEFVLLIFFSQGLELPTLLFPFLLITLLALICSSRLSCNAGVQRFNPAFPSTCPYVLSFGGTQWKPNTLTAAANPKSATRDVIQS